MVKVKNNGRYFYKCSCDQLRKRPLILHIFSIFNDSKRELITKSEINKIGKTKYPDWPKDPNTIFRALKTMHKCKFIIEKRRGQGHSTLWSLNKKQIYDRELMIHEIRQLEKIVNRLPEWVFEVENFKDKINIIWQNIRTALVELENQDLTSFWILFRIKEEEIFKSKDFSLLDKQLSIIFIYGVLYPCQKTNKKWFDLSQKPYSVKSDIDLMGLFIKHFNKDSTRDDINKDINRHTLNTNLSKKLEFLMILCYYNLKIEHDNINHLFEKDKSSFVINNEWEKYNKNVSTEKIHLYLERSLRRDNVLELMKRKQEKDEDIDLFIEKYKKSYLINQETQS